MLGNIFISAFTISVSIKNIHSLRGQTDQEWRLKFGFQKPCWVAHSLCNSRSRGNKLPLPASASSALTCTKLLPTHTHIQNKNMKDKYLNLLPKLDITRLTFAGWFAPPPQTPVELFPFSILSAHLLMNTLWVFERALAHFPFRLASGACRGYPAMTCRFRMASS